MKKFLLSLLFLAVGIVAVAQRSPAPFKKGDRISFIGNSITEAGFYEMYIWQYYMLHFPDRRIEIRNAGIGGDVARQILDRFDDDVKAYDPSVVVVTFGMNDSRYFEYYNNPEKKVRDEAVLASKTSYNSIEKKLQALEGVEKIIMTSSPYDETMGGTKNLFPGKYKTMEAIAQFQQESASKNKWAFVDLMKPMTAINLREQKKDTTFTLTGPDRIHPGNAGHFAMAWLFLKAQGLTNSVVANVKIDANKANLIAADNCSVSNVKKDGDALTFQYIANSLPFPSDDQPRVWENPQKQSDALAVIPFTEEFNKELFAITGLSANGEYRLLIDGDVIGTYRGSEFEKGINLAVLKNTPQYKQAVKVAELNLRYRDLEQKLRAYYWLQYNYFRKKNMYLQDDQAAVDSVNNAPSSEWAVASKRDNYQQAFKKETREQWKKEMKAILDEIYTINKPVTRNVRIEPILGFASVLQSNMVVQQNKPFKVFGTATPKELVVINADWLSEEVITRAKSDGSFIGIINVPVAKPNDFSKHIIRIESAGMSKQIDNLLIGDVWFMSGQSNMQFKLRETIDSATQVPNANYPGIRLFYAGLNFSATPTKTVSGKWVECTPNTAKDFSAVGYSFGKQLHTSLNIPIGVVFSGIGASSAQAFVPQEVLASDTMLNRIYLQPYLQSDRAKEIIDGGFTFEKVTRPFLLYNAMIHPFTNLSIRGFCWYQGESNRNERQSYTHLTQQLISSWRKQFAQDNLPFYYVQVAPFFWDKEDPSLNDYAFFREAQAQIAELGNTEMVLTMDVGESRDLHPKNKRPIGERLARTALNRTYGKLEVPYHGPRFKYSETAKNKVILHFCEDTICKGLKTNDGNKPRHFLIAGDDKKFHPADARIDGNKIIVQSDAVKKPVAVRYAFTNDVITNLENSEGLPAVPFRTDAWPE